MKKEIYEAVKARISVASDAGRASYLEMYPDSKDAIVYWFNLDGIDDDELPGILHAMKTKNMWNVAQRFYAIIKYYDDIDNILLSNRHVSCK